MIYNNRESKFGDDLKIELTKNSKIQIATSVFSIYGFEALAKELEKIDEFQFIFKDPTFIKKENSKKEEKFFEIKRAEIEKSIGGTNFEVHLKNKMDTMTIAKECAKWIEKKATFKTNCSGKKFANNFFNIENPENKITYLNTGDFTSEGLGYRKDNSISYTIFKSDDSKVAKDFIDQFDVHWNCELHDVTTEVINFVKTLYKENSPQYIYYITLYYIFHEFLEDINEDNLANDNIQFRETVVYKKLFDFQKDAVTGIINKLETHNGCILADSVGLGKTFTSLAVIKYYELRNKNVLVLCPKKLADNWNTYRSNYRDNLFKDDRFNYDVLFHTDLSRRHGDSNGMDLSRVQMENYDLIVIDESHNFRNNSARKDRRTRYQILLEDVIKKGVKTKVLMLSATPVNNKFMDLSNQLNLAYEGNVDMIDDKISSKKSIKKILSDAQQVFNDWSKLDNDERTNDRLIGTLSKNFEFFKLLDSVTIARSRKHIQTCYNIKEIGDFPKRNKPINVYSELTTIKNFDDIKSIYDELSKLNLAIYNPFSFILPGMLGKYEEEYDTVTERGTSFKQQDREKSLLKLMRVNMLKRLESSVDSFRITLDNLENKIEENLVSIEKYNEHQQFTIEVEEYNVFSDEEDIDFSIGKKVKIDLEDIDLDNWKIQLEKDKNILNSILNKFIKITPEYDTKLLDLKELIIQKQSNPINPNNKKVIIFTSFADTAKYIYDEIKHLGNAALITGSGQNKCNIKGISPDFNNLLINFSPIAKSRDNLSESSDVEIDILVATDCISEGQNLQDCDYLINYDIHWNPVRIIQRFGRIDRIGSKNKVIQLVNFWPNISLDEYINLKSRVKDRMKILDLSATGSDNVLDADQKETEFRKSQLETLKEEVIDLEETQNSISITDLGLNEFRMDLLEFIKTNGDIANVATGIHSVVAANNTLEPGVMFVLKNINNAINSEQQNQIHPFYIVYIKDNGEILYNHLKAKETLDFMRMVCRNEKQPINKAYESFNAKTKDGRNMEFYSDLLNQTINSIVNVNDISIVDSLFSPSGIVTNQINGIDDFELLTFLVII
ncbi:MAG: SNF2-related protein [Mycoplasmatales bacterium]